MKGYSQQAVCTDTSTDASSWGSSFLDPSNPDLSQLLVLDGSINCTLYNNILHISAVHASEAPPASQLRAQAEPADHAHNHNPADPTKSETQPKQPQNKLSPKQKEIKEQIFTFTEIFIMLISFHSQCFTVLKFVARLGF